MSAARVMAWLWKSHTHIQAYMGTMVAVNAGHYSSVEALEPCACKDAAWLQGYNSYPEGGRSPTHSKAAEAYTATCTAGMHKAVLIV